MIAADILRLVSGALQDLEPDMESRWAWEGGNDGRIGLLDFLNSAVRSVCIQRPDAMVVTEPILLEPGMRQKLPRKRIHQSSRDASQLFELTRNMGEDGESPGTSIISVRPTVLLAFANAKHSSTSIDNFAYDRIINKDVYYVYPAVPENIDVWVEASYSAAPETISEPSQELVIADEYAPALEHHMLASIFSGDNESSNSMKAQYHIQMYSSVLGIKMQTDLWPKAKSSMNGGGV